MSQKGPYVSTANDTQPIHGRTPYVTFDSHPNSSQPSATSREPEPRTAPPPEDTRDLVAELLRQRRKENVHSSQPAKSGSASFLSNRAKVAQQPPHKRVEDRLMGYKLRVEQEILNKRIMQKADELRQMRPYPQSMCESVFSPSDSAVW